MYYIVNCVILNEITYVLLALYNPTPLSKKALKTNVTPRQISVYTRIHLWTYINSNSYKRYVHYLTPSQSYIIIILYQIKPLGDNYTRPRKRIYYPDTVLSMTIMTCATSHFTILHRYLSKLHLKCYYNQRA